MPNWRKMTHDQMQAGVAQHIRTTEDLTGLHVFTDAELRARDERIIKESFRVARQTFLTSSSHIDAIIAAAEVDQ